MEGLTKHIIMNQIILTLYQSCSSHLLAFGKAGCTKPTLPLVFFCLATLEQAKIRLSQGTKKKHLLNLHLENYTSV